jgi:hypothetical protein
VEGGEQAAGGQHQRAPGQDCALVIDPVQVATGHVGHTDGTGRTVQKLVAISKIQATTPSAKTSKSKTKPTTFCLAYIFWLKEKKLNQKPVLLIHPNKYSPLIYFEN